MLCKSGYMLSNLLKPIPETTKKCTLQYEFYKIYLENSTLAPQDSEAQLEQTQSQN